MAALVLTACVPSDKQADKQGGDDASEVATGKPDKSAPAASKPKPAGPPALSRYLGKYPDDKIDGVDFLHHPQVVKAVNDAVSDLKIRALILSGKDRTGPIIGSRGRLYMRYDDPRSAGSYNWALLMAQDGTSSAVCVAEGDPVPDVSGAQWYSEGVEAFQLYAPCPYEAADLEQMTSDWPIHPMPS
ncbi:hypothetical protein V474_14015 [Novosphingobium barchaimii LL02]|uniref:Uncharacterized protein n=1 Tax=Novosphingobium barchaimii LL02 TaxID=1114963 RepID=A0A0J7XY77_9SPHN|nr:hypothetical protein [Novosphingobium barchaimii]KMS56621.1 hypothetical protein V474_14015 [Novosphingobium barchaimii LL02]